MDQPTNPSAPAAPLPKDGPDAIILKGIKQTASEMSTWLKFLGVISIIYGALTFFTIIGLLYIWLGILLFQAGSSASNAQFGGSQTELVTMVQKLKTFFMVSAILVIISLAFMIIVFITVGASLIPMIQSLSGYQY
jgi:hypothetical protein